MQTTISKLFETPFYQAVFFLIVNEFTDKPDGVFRNLHLITRESMQRQLFGHQMLHRNVHFLFLGVPRNLDDLHSVK